MEYKYILRRTNYLELSVKPLKEHWFVVIKPETYSSIIYEIIKAINESKLDIVDIISHDLTHSEAEVGFGTKPQFYRDYLCSSPLLCILVYGENAARKCLMIKEKIRIRYNVGYEIYKNYIHVAEEGLEYKLQKDIFLSEYECVSYADLYIKWRPGILETISEKVGKVHWVGIVTQESTYPLFVEELLRFPKEKLQEVGILAGIQYTYGNHSCISFLSPWLLEDIYGALAQNSSKQDRWGGFDGEGVNFLEITNNGAVDEQITFIEECLNSHNYKGIMAMSPRYDMHRMEAIGDICYEKQLVTWGGSEDADKLGQYVTPMFRFQRFLNAFKNI